jgi:hypothetical protein
MSDLSDAHDRAVERGRDDAINLVPFTANSYKKSDYGLGVAWEQGWRTYHRPLNTVYNGQGNIFVRNA